MKTDYKLLTESLPECLLEGEDGEKEEEEEDAAERNGECAHLQLVKGWCISVHKLGRNTQTQT